MSRVAKIWRDQVGLVSRAVDGSPEESLCYWFDMQLFSKGEFASFVDAVSKGMGYGDDSGTISLPVNIIDDSLDEGRRERCFEVEVVFFSHCDEPNDVSRVPVSMFVFYLSLAIMIYAKYVDDEIDPFSLIEQIQRGCSPEVQFALVPDDQKKNVGLEWRHWQRWSSSENADDEGRGEAGWSS